MIREREIRNIVVAMTLIVAAMLHCQSATAQHTLSLIGGAGASYARFYPTEEIKMLWLKQGGEIIDCPRPLMHGGISWRYYSPKPRFVGAVGIDLEYMERGYKMGYAYTSEYVGEGDNRHEIRHYRYYTRYVNSVMLPFVWQPHVYVAKNKLRIFIDAAFVLSYNISSRYEYENNAYPAGKYEWKVPRDNRFGYGLAGGAGFAVLLKQVEIGVRARYYFGYSDILKNRNKYYSSTTDGRENPFYYSPLRSPIDNLTFSLSIGWRFNKEGFEEWKIRKKREKALDEFNFSGATNSGNSSAPRGGTRMQTRQ